MRTSTEFMSWISAATIFTSFDFHERFMCIILCPNIIEIAMCCCFVTFPKLMPTRTDFES